MRQETVEGTMVSICFADVRRLSTLDCLDCRIVVLIVVLPKLNLHPGRSDEGYAPSSVADCIVAEVHFEYGHL